MNGGLPPVHKSTTTNRNSPPRAAGGQGSFDSRARSGWESGSPTPTPPAPGSPCDSRRTSGPLGGFGLMAPFGNHMTGSREGGRRDYRASNKLMAANSVRCPRGRGESVKGGPPPPFHKKATTNRNSPPRTESSRKAHSNQRDAAGVPICGAKRRAVRKRGSHCCTLRPLTFRSMCPASGPLGGFGLTAPFGNHVTVSGGRTEYGASNKLMAANTVRCPRFWGKV